MNTQPLLPAIHDALRVNSVVLLFGKVGQHKTSLAKEALSKAIYIDSSKPGQHDMLEADPHGFILDNAHNVDTQRLKSLISATQILKIPTIIVCQTKDDATTCLLKAPGITIVDTDSDLMSVENVAEKGWY